MLAPLSGVMGAIALLAVAAIHVYWAFGGLWPANDREALARTVLGGGPGLKMPGTGACLGVAVVVVGAALVVLAASGLVALPVPQRLTTWASYAVAAVLVLRGIGGFFERRQRPAIVGSPYARLNVVFYSPLCLALGALCLVGTVCR